MIGKSCIENVLMFILICYNVFVESLENAIESLSPAAAATSRLLKSGLTLTQLYSQYAQVSEELMMEKDENRRLNLYMNAILKVHIQIL